MQTFKNSNTALITQPDFKTGRAAGLVRATFASRDKPNSLAIYMEAIFSQHGENDKIAVRLHPRNSDDADIGDLFPDLPRSYSCITQAYDDDALHGNFLQSRNKKHIGYCVLGDGAVSLGPKAFLAPEQLFDVLKSDPVRYNVDPKVVAEAEAFYHTMVQGTGKERFIDLPPEEKARRLKAGPTI